MCTYTHLFLLRSCGSTLAEEKPMASPTIAAAQAHSADLSPHARERAARNTLSVSLMVFPGNHVVLTCVSVRVGVRTGCGVVFRLLHAADQGRQHLRT